MVRTCLQYKEKKTIIPVEHTSETLLLANMGENLPIKFVHIVILKTDNIHHGNTMYSIPY